MDRLRPQNRRPQVSSSPHAQHGSAGAPILHLAETPKKPLINPRGSLDNACAVTIQQTGNKPYCIIAARRLATSSLNSSAISGRSSSS